MTELSPAAKAVLIAEAKSRCLREERGCHPDEDDWNGCWFCVHRRGLAAALRAAASQLLAVQWNGQIPVSATEQIGINWARDALHVLANELEAQ